MDPNIKGRQTYDGAFGQSRLFIAENDSRLYFDPGSLAYALIWSTEESAVPALCTLLDRELTENQTGYGTLLYGPQDPGGLFEDSSGLRKVWDKLNELATTDPGNVQFLKFDSDIRSVALSALPLRRDALGIGYIISRENDKPSAAAAEAMRQAFEQTAADSIKPQLSWALEALNS